MTVEELAKAVEDARAHYEALGISQRADTPLKRAEQDLAYQQARQKFFRLQADLEERLRAPRFEDDQRN